MPSEHHSAWGLSVDPKVHSKPHIHLGEQKFVTEVKMKPQSTDIFVPAVLQQGLSLVPRSGDVLQKV